MSSETNAFESDWTFIKFKLLIQCLFIIRLLCARFYNHTVTKILKNRLMANGGERRGRKRSYFHNTGLKINRNTFSTHARPCSTIHIHKRDHYNILLRRHSMIFPTSGDNGENSNYRGGFRIDVSSSYPI